MNTIAYLRRVLPSLTTSLGFLVLPLLLSVYFVVTRYSQRFVAEQEITYFDVQNSWLSQLFLDQKWIGWFNRFMDFAFWGVLAAIILLGVWMFSSAKIAMKNHYAKESFVNFQESKRSWHTHFFVVAAIKAIAVIVVLFALLTLIGQRIPALAVEITSLTQDFSWRGVWPAAYAALYLVFLQFVIVACVKVFRAAQVD